MVIEEILATLLEAVEAGERPPFAEFLRRYPEHSKDILECQELIDYFYSKPGETVSAYSNQNDTQPDVPREKGMADFEIEKLLGEGGEGKVYKAWQKSLRRYVALKELPQGAPPEARARHRREAVTLAQIRPHPNIVQVYDIIEDGEKPYISMEHVEGGTLADRLDKAPLRPKEATELVRKLAQAVHYAHQQDILHRDLKPANVLLTETGEPKLSDFGLAKQIADSGITITGAIVGTPAYMSPEAAKGEPVSEKSDVYGLGAILYECLTGTPPFRGYDLSDTLQQVRERDPAPIRLHNPRVSRHLESICLKCLEKDPQKRRSTAKALAEDLDHEIHRQIGEEFHTWGNMLLVWAGVILVTHVVLFLNLFPLIVDRSNRLIYVCQFSLMGLTYLLCRPPLRIAHMGKAERRLWIVTAAYLLGCFLLDPIKHSLPLMDDPGTAFKGYPYACLLTGLYLFVLGSSYWASFYLFGAAFFLLSMIMTFHLKWAPLEFGLLWTITLIAIAVHLRRQSTVKERQ